MSEANIIIDTIVPVEAQAPKKMGRPKGSKNKKPSPLRGVKRKPRKISVTPKMQNPKKTDSFAVGVSPQHYWLISALAEARSVSRMEILEGIISKYVASLGENAK